MIVPLLAILCLYDYRDELGRLLYQVIRYEPGHEPRFSQRRPDGRGFWINNLDGVRRVLYRLEAVIAAATAGGVIFVVEGERDVHSAERLGLVATCCAGGAGGWRPEFAQWLRGCREVVVVADRDPAGTRYARNVSASLHAVAPCRIARSAAGNDLSDHFYAGFGIDQLVPFELPEASGGTHPRRAFEKDGMNDGSDLLGSDAGRCARQAGARGGPGDDRMWVRCPSGADHV